MVKTTDDRMKSVRYHQITKEFSERFVMVPLGQKVFYYTDMCY